MSDSDDDVPLAKRVPVVKKEATVKTEADGQAEKGKGPAIKAEKSSPDGTSTNGAKGASAANNNMPAIPKDEPSESTKKTPAGKAAKENKAATGKKSSTEKASKPKTKAAKEAAAHGKADKAAGAAKRERKVFDMPGQTRDTPPEEDPLRKFYMSLREQRSDSVIAAKWLMQVGLLPREEAEVEAAKLKNARSPVKAPRRSSTGAVKRKMPAANENKASGKKAKPAGNGAKKKPAKKAKKDESESEDDDSDSDFDDEAPLAKRKRPAPKKTPASAPAKRPAPKGKKDVAFTDGGLDGEDSSDDDLPLAQRAVKLNS